MPSRKSRPMMTIERPAGTIQSSEAAKRLGVSKPTMIAWFESGKVRGWRNVVNRRVFIFESEIQRLIREGYEREKSR